MNVSVKTYTVATVINYSFFSMSLSYNIVHDVRTLADNPFLGFTHTAFWCFLLGCSCVHLCTVWAASA